MCDPLTIAGAALSVGSAAANHVANTKVRRAREDVTAAERIRQRGLDAEADLINRKSQDRYEDFEPQREERSEELGDFIAQTQRSDALAPSNVLPSSQSSVITQEGSRQRERAQDFTDNQARMLGDLRSFGDLLSDIGRLQARDASSVGQIGGFKVGSSNVAALELDAANRAGGGLRLLGDVLGGIGNVGMTAGLSGGSLFGNSMSSSMRNVPIPGRRPTATVRLGDIWSMG